MADELIDILDATGSLTGEIKLKSIAHKHGLWHASAQIWIYTPTGQVLIQKRAINKDTYPNLWDISVAGHLSAGDTPSTAAVREIQEEIGVKISEEKLFFLKTIRKSNRISNTIIDNEFNHLYVLEFAVNINELKLQTEEVTAVKLIDINDLEKQLKIVPASFVPHGKTYYNYIISAIKAKLKIK
ncbi:NUDIX hydrolase [Aquimarina agarivorans]|uniref:NUDIX hydrolase n=1 Tax=Aquimarina agarivorans TaxID=980584 RepID=UPI000248F8F3|nr:NUDIX domain-containing protein [Aquimarina agarivorans]